MRGAPRGKLHAVDDAKPDAPALPTDEGLLADAREALRELLTGNERFATGNPIGHLFSPAERAALVAGQHPIAVLLGCVDARVPPELVLDQPVGGLLTVRTAGQALAGVAMGSIEFGVRVLGVPLVVVLGPTGCGAVLAAMSDQQTDGHLASLTGEVATRLSDVVGDDPVKATGANLNATVDALRRVGSLVTPDRGPAVVVGVMYDMATGRVTVTDDAGLDIT